MIPATLGCLLPLLLAPAAPPPDGGAPPADAHAHVRPARERGEALVAAATAGSLRRTRALLAEGADANQVTAAGQTPLGAAAWAGEQAVVEALLGAGARPDGRGPGSQAETPLMLAVRSPYGAHQLRIVRLLVAAGADVNATTAGAEADPGTSPLTEALRSCEPALVRLLIGLGARRVVEQEGLCGTAARPAPEEIRALVARVRRAPRK